MICDLPVEQPAWSASRGAALVEPVERSAWSPFFRSRRCRQMHQPAPGQRSWVLFPGVHHKYCTITLRKSGVAKIGIGVTQH